MSSLPQFPRVCGEIEIMKRFWAYLGGTVIRPRSTFTRLVADPHHLAYGVGAQALIGLLYTLTVIGLAMVKAKIMVPPWVAIPAESYYFWEIFFAAPVFLAGWILAAGIVQLLSKPFGGTGTFEGTLAVLGFAMTVPAFVTWIPETLGTILMLTGVMTQEQWLAIIAQPGFWQVFAQVYQFVALGWYFLLIPLAVAAAQKARWWGAVVIGLLTLGIVGLWIFLFIR